MTSQKPQKNQRQGSWPITKTNMSTMKVVHPSRGSLVGDNNLQSDLVSTRSRTFGTPGPTTSWASINNMPPDLAAYAIDPATWQDAKATDIKRHTFDEKLEPFQKAALCINGDEPSKIFAAHDVISLVKINADRTFNDIIPMIESELKNSTCSEFHSEFAQSLILVFRDMMRARSVQRIKHILEFANYMIENTTVEIMPHWLGAVEGIIDLMSPKDAMTQILPLIEAKTKAEKPEVKSAACILMKKLVTHSPDDKTNPLLINSVHVLITDDFVTVRSAACLLLPDLISKSDIETTKLFERDITLLSQDSSTGVKAFLVDSICRIIIAGKIEGATIINFIGILKRIVKEAYAQEPQNISLLVHFSKYMATITKIPAERQSLTQEDKLWFLDAFILLSRFDLPATFGKGGKGVPAGFSNFRNKMDGSRRASVLDSLMSTPLKGDKGQKPNDTSIKSASNSNGSNNNEEIEKWMCRAHIAANFPEFVIFAKPLVDFKNGLHPIVTDLIHDPNESVRKNMAANMFQLMEQVGEQAGILKEEIVRVLSDDDVDVIEALIPNLANIMKILVKTQVVSPENTTSALAEIGGVILFCEERLSQTRDWRVHSSLLLQMVVLPFCIPCDYIYSNFVPILLHRLLHLNQLPSRLGAAEALVSFLRNCRRANQRDDIRRKIRGFAQSRSAQDRMLYLYMSNMIMDRFSRKYFRDHFFETTLGLAEDTIPNVRTKAYRLMPKMKEKTRMAEDAHLFKKLEEVVQKIQKSETDRDAVEAINAAVLEMAKIDSYLKSEAALRKGKEDKYDKEDLKKEREEVFIASLETQMPKLAPKRNSTDKNQAKEFNVKTTEMGKPIHHYAPSKSTVESDGTIPSEGKKTFHDEVKKPPAATVPLPPSTFNLTQNSRNIVPLANIKAMKIPDENSSQTTVSMNKPKKKN